MKEAINNNWLVYLIKNFVTQSQSINYGKKCPPSDETGENHSIDDCSCITLY